MPQGDCRRDRHPGIFINILSKSLAYNTYFPYLCSEIGHKEGENGSGTGINSRAICRKMCCLNGSRKLL